jgi:SAM-dependent methyltransferase
MNPDMPKVDNRKIYDEHWVSWIDMKVHGPASRWLRALIGDLCAELPHEVGSILDVGCGEGTTTHFIARKFPRARVKGIDFSEAGIECARSRWQLQNLEFAHELDSASLNGQYDLVTCFEVLEHVEDWQGLLTRMGHAAHRYLMLSFPTGRMRPFEVIVGHVRNFQRGEVESFLDGFNFAPKKLFYAGFPFYSPLYREICNLTNAAGNQFTQGRYGFSQKMIASVFYTLFRFVSTKNHSGDQFCGLFEKRSLTSE